MNRLQRRKKAASRAGGAGSPGEDDARRYKSWGDYCSKKLDLGIGASQANKLLQAARAVREINIGNIVTDVFAINQKQAMALAAIPDPVKRAYQMIDAATVSETLSSIARNIAPRNERQAAELVRVEPDLRDEARGAGFEDVDGLAGC